MLSSACKLVAQPLSPTQVSFISFSTCNATGTLQKSNETCVSEEITAAQLPLIAMWEKPQQFRLFSTSLWVVRELFQPTSNRWFYTQGWNSWELNMEQSIKNNLFIQIWVSRGLLAGLAKKFILDHLLGEQIYVCFYIYTIPMFRDSEIFYVF